RGGTLAERLHQMVGFAAHGDDDATSHAAFTYVAERRTRDVVDGLSEYGVGHDDQRVLRTGQGLDALAVRSSRAVDVLGGRLGAHERDRAHLRMLEDAIDCI